MPRRCVAAGCSTTTGEGYSLHEFPRDIVIREKWTQAVKRFRDKWDGPSASSVLCSKHFEPECFVVEGIRYRESMGIPAKKRLKSGAIPTIFVRSTHGESTSSKPSASCKRTAFEKRQRQTVSDKLFFITNINFHESSDSKGNLIHQY